MDLSSLSTEDLLALKAGDLSKVSTAGLRSLKGTEKPLIETQPQAETPKPNFMSILDRIPGSSVVTGPVEGAASMLSGMVAKPVSDVAGLAATGYDILRGNKSGDPTGFKNEVQSALTYAPRTKSGSNVAEYNPLALIAKRVDWLGSGAQNNLAPSATSGPLQSALGAGVHEAINQAPMFLGYGAKPVAKSLSGVMDTGSQNMMQSALKPTFESLRTGKAQSAIKTLLDEGINVTPGGVETMRGRIDQLNQRLKDTIANSSAVIDKQAVVQKLQPVYERFLKQVNSTSDVAAIQRAAADFQSHPLLTSDQIPVQLAQELKQGTYRSLGEKSYGELKGAEIEAQKALARGLKDEIASAVPKVKALNAEESRLLNALSPVERRVMMDANKNPVGLGWLTINPAKFALWMADRSPLFKSLIARMLNSGGGAIDTMGSVGPAAGLLTPKGTTQSNDSLQKRGLLDTSQ